MRATSFIALTGADALAIEAVAHHLVELTTRNGHAVAILLGVSDVEQAQGLADTAAVDGAAYELWRVGTDPARAAMDPMVDRHIEITPDVRVMLDQVEHCLGLALEETTV